MAKKRKRTGPRSKIGEIETAKILAILENGGSVVDAAKSIGIDRKTIYNHRQSDPEFSTGLDRAVATGKLKLIERISTAPIWQAAAWMLERRWGKEFGKKERFEHTGANGGSIKTDARHTLDLSQFSDEELLKIERAFTRGASGTGAPGRN